ncbi:putative leader peptide [Streptomyces antibioticus]|uniref:putative leader peptide n=1 Tax=Streptomyces antibioticus TaxID=1890 RepID=UPI00340D3AFA
MSAACPLHVRCARRPLPLSVRLAAFLGTVRSALLTARGHIDLLRVASAACRR